MKPFFLLCLMITGSLTSQASAKDSTWQYNLPDSVKAISLLAEISAENMNNKGYFSGGIQTDAVSLFLSANKRLRSIRFAYPYSASVLAKGKDATTGLKEGLISFSYPWETGKTYRLLIATTSDSAENFSLYSGYIWLPEPKQWKLIGTCKIKGRWNTLQQTNGFYRKSARNTGTCITSQVWCQRRSGSWRSLSGNEATPPPINLASHADSLYQWNAEIKEIGNAMIKGTTDVKLNTEGVYYIIMKEGSGRQVTVEDTVTVHYKGYLFSDGTVFDQTKEKPATFPLKRLIRGWQIGIPLCRVGGKIKLVIPSALAYSIRTRAAKIPPNSILVFEIEVVDTKSP